MKLILDVADCMDCPCREAHYGHGECFEYCDHPNSPPGYESVLFGCQEAFKETPAWCPLKES